MRSIRNKLILQHMDFLMKNVYSLRNFSIILGDAFYSSLSLQRDVSIGYVHLYALFLNILFLFR